MALHGRTTLSDPAPPHAQPPGEREVEIDGVTYRLGAKAGLRLGERHRERSWYSPVGYD